MADVMAWAGAVVFSAGGLYLMGSPELVMLRLAVLDLPGWPVYVLGLLQIGGGVALLGAGSRRPALVLLAVISVGELVASAVYRELEPAVQAMVQLLLLTGIFLLGSRRLV